MDDPVFDAFLKTALEEALRRDAEEGPEISAPSRRQRKRMRRLLAEPCSSAAETVEPETAGKPRNPVRWLSVVIIAALLTGAAAAGLALGGGEYFRQTFAESRWAEDYGTAADTEQLLEMSVEMDTAQAEADGLRVEIMDAVFDGQIALFALRVTVLDQDLLDRLREEDGRLALGQAWVFSEEGKFFQDFSFSFLEEDGAEEGQYLAECSVLDETLGSAGLCRVQINDLVLFPLGGGRGDVLRKGPWTLSAALRPTEALRLAPGRSCRVDGEDWVLDSLTLTPLALRLTLHQPGEPYPEAENWILSEYLTFYMKDGSTVTPARYSRVTHDDDGTLRVDIRFPMPLDLAQVEYLHLFGEDIDLEE